METDKGFTIFGTSDSSSMQFILRRLRIASQTKSASLTADKLLTLCLGGGRETKEILKPSRITSNIKSGALILSHFEMHLASLPQTDLSDSS